MQSIAHRKVFEDIVNVIMRRSIEILLLLLMLPMQLLAAAELTAGRAAAEDGLHEIAVRHLSAALEAGEQDAKVRGQALALLLESLDALTRYDQMLTVLAETERAPLAPGVSGFWKARALLSLERSDEALVALSGGGDAGEGAWRGRVERLRARCLIEEGRTNDAMKVLAKVAEELGPSSARAAVEVDWARLAFQTGRFTEADEVLSRVPVQESSPELRQVAAVLRGRTLLELGRMPEAAALLSSLGRDDALPNALRSTAWSEAARAYRALPDATRELEALAKAVEQLT